MTQGAANWYVKPPLILAVLGTSLSAGRLSGNLWWQRLMENARAQPEAVGPIVLQNFGQGSQQSTYGVTRAPDIAAFNPTHILSEGFAINDCAALPSVISRPDHLANMAAMRAIWKAKNPAVDITWQTMNGVSAAGAALRPDLQLYYDDEVTFAATNGDRMIDHYYGLPTPPAPAGGWPKPLPEYLCTDGDGLHPLWEGSLEVYFWPAMIYWLRCRMAEHWGLPIPNPPEPPPLPDADYLMAAGGGGGGAYVGAGGGGGGRRRAGAFLSNLLGPVLVGFGGPKGAGSGPTSKGYAGHDTFLGSLVARGGGFGAGYSISSGTGPGGDGGSGGGSYGPGVSPGAGTPGQGNAGGLGLNPNSRAGGGGGAGAAGGDGASGGVGGVGVLADWPGVPALTYICGGGGGAQFTAGTPAYPNGGGPTNYGGGGRGGDEAGGTSTCDNGGDGGAWVWYPGAARATGGTITSFGGFTVHQFTRADMAPTVRMAANVSGGFTVSASSEFSGTYAAFKATNGLGGFWDGTTDNCWASVSGGAMPQWWKIQLPASKAFKAYRIMGRNYAPSATQVPKQGPKSWIVEGSPDNVAWTLCDTRNNEPVFGSEESRLYTMNGPGAGTAFLYYRITVSAIQDNAASPLLVTFAAFDLCPVLEPI